MTRDIFRRSPFVAITNMKQSGPDLSRIVVLISVSGGKMESLQDR